MRFSEFSGFLERLDKTASRNEITAILAELFAKTSASEIDKAVYLSLGQLAPNYQGLVLNLAEKMMLRVISLASGTELSKVTGVYKKEGDLGNTAFALIPSQDSSLTVTQVFAALLAVANDSGKGSQERKVALMSKLLSSLDKVSAKYVARIPVGKLRLGFSDMTILDGLSYLLTGNKSARHEIEAVFNVSVDIGRIAKIVKEKGLDGLKNITAQAGTPIRPSLAERLPSAEKILEKVGKTVAIEPKFDGFRSQIHIYKEGRDKKVMIFSRNLENTTAMFPDLVEAALKIDVDSAIFDGEAIAYDAKNDRYLPFQETVQRKRKHGVGQAVKDVPLKLFIFDVLFLNGKDFLNVPFGERRKTLEKIRINSPIIQIVQQDLVDNADVMRDFIKKYLTEGLEGAVIKMINAPYKAGGRGYHWVKYKKTTEEGVADTIDCVVMGVYRGKGKRTGFGAGAFLVGVKDKENFLSVSKIGTGLTDEQWRELDRRTNNLKIANKPQEYRVDKNLAPDIWTKPELVVEILADEITKSPIHAAGLALRFPRLIRFRDDKPAEETDTIKQLVKFYKMQKTHDLEVK